MKNQHRSCRTLRSDDAVLLDEPGDRLAREGVFELGCKICNPRRAVKVRVWNLGATLDLNDILLMRAGNEQERAIELVDLIQKDCHVGDTRRRHPVLFSPEYVVLMPFPLVAAEGRFG